LQALIAAGRTPPAVHDQKCEHCSLHTVCLPEGSGVRSASSRYLASAFAAARAGPPAME
jgi:hypothetical protein